MNYGEGKLAFVGIGVIVLPISHGPDPEEATVALMTRNWSLGRDRGSDPWVKARGLAPMS